MSSVVWRPLNRGGLKPAPPSHHPSSSFSIPGETTEDGRKRFRDRRAAARVNNGTTSFREVRRRWTGTRVHARSCMREVLIGSVRGWGAQKQPSGQTSQHQSAPVTRARTIGANIAILPAFTFDGEKDNDRSDGIASAGVGDSKLPWKLETIGRGA